MKSKQSATLFYGLLLLVALGFSWRTLANLLAADERSLPFGRKPEFLARDYYDC